MVRGEQNGLITTASFCEITFPSEGKPPDTGIVSEYANTAALLFEQNGVAGPHLTGREDRRVNSRALPVLLNDAFQNFWA